MNILKLVWHLWYFLQFLTFLPFNSYYCITKIIEFFLYKLCLKTDGAPELNNAAPNVSSREFDPLQDQSSQQKADPAQTGMKEELQPTEGWYFWWHYCYNTVNKFFFVSECFFIIMFICLLVFKLKHYLKSNRFSIEIYKLFCVKLTSFNLFLIDCNRNYCKHSLLLTACSFLKFYLCRQCL